MIYLQFGHIGGTISNEIPCTSARQAAILASNIARVSGKFCGSASLPDQWMVDRRTHRIRWSDCAQTYFVELVKKP